MVQRYKKHLWLLAITACMSLALIPSSLFAQDFIQGYQSEKPLLKGAMVSNIKDSQTNVAAASIENNDLLLGVVVKSDELALSLTSDTEGVFVASSGKFEVLVSDVNGVVRAGDYITSSPIAGVGMLADSRQTRVLGTAVQDLDLTDSNNILSTVDITDENGEVRSAAIAKLLVEIKANENPLTLNALEKAPGFIVDVGEALAGKPISPLRVYAGLAIAIASLAASATILYGTIKTSFIAIGRNPLARRSVMAGMWQTIVIAIMVFAAGGFAVYLVLRL